LVVTNSFISARLSRSKFFRRIVIHPQHPTFSFQARPALEPTLPFRLIPYWTILPVDNSFPDLVHYMQSR
jgi:hypothetical protein